MSTDGAGLTDEVLVELNPPDDDRPELAADSEPEPADPLDD